MPLKITVEEVNQLIFNDEEKPPPYNNEPEATVIVSRNNEIESENYNQREIETNKVENTLRKVDTFFTTISDKDCDNENSDWYIVGASATGKSHLKANKPCDDYHYCINIKNNWGVAVVCDGAGSAINSSLGAKAVSQSTARLLKDEVLNRNWHESMQLPDDKEWEEAALGVLQRTQAELYKYASDHHYDFKSLSCTVIAIIYSPAGLLVTHIGDGRAAYCNKQGEWKCIITPHKGEETNETVFITVENLLQADKLSISEMKIPETKLIRDNPAAFTLMTDGCEKYSFFCSRFNSDENIWSDPNLPSDKFFQPLVKNLKSLKSNNIKLSEANEKWSRFLNDGIPGFKEEADDKTMILGILI